MNNSTSSGRPSMLRLAGAMAVVQLTASVCYPIAKYGLEIIEPFTFAFYRFILSSVVLLAVVKFRKHSVPIEKQDWKRIVLLGVLIIPFNQTLFLIGQSMTGAGHGAFIFSTTPVWVFILAIIHLKEKVTVRKVVGFSIALAGVLVIMLSGAIEIGTDYLYGDLIIVVSVIAWGYYTILGKVLVQKYGALRITAYALSIGSALYLPFGFYFAADFDYSQTTPAAWGSVAYMALGLSGVVYVTWYWLLKHLEASRIAVYHNIQPVIATVLAAIFLGEAIGLPFIVGGAAVIAGLLVTEL